MIRDHQVYGVEFFRNKTVQQSRARKEVILSAGAIGSAQIMMLSGIGPRKHLESLDVSGLLSIVCLFFTSFKLTGIAVEEHSFHGVFFLQHF